MSATVYTLAAVRREHRRLTHLVDDLAARDDLVPAAESLIRSAVQDLADAGDLLRDQFDRQALTC